MTNKEKPSFLADADKHYDTEKSEDRNGKEHQGIESRHDDANARDKIKKYEGDETHTLYDADTRNLSIVSDNTDVNKYAKEHEGNDTSTFYNTRTNDAPLNRGGAEMLDEVKKHKGNNISTFYDDDTKIDDILSIHDDGIKAHDEKKKHDNSALYDTKVNEMLIIDDSIDIRDTERKSDNTSTLYNINTRDTFSASHSGTDTGNTSKEHDSHNDMAALGEEKARNGVHKSDDKPDDSATLSPGTRLRQTREQQNLSVKHIADRLYLGVHVIEALEADNYEGLPPTIFVRGYLRNYAKLLEISPESIIESFDHITEQQQPSPVFKEKKQKKQASSHDPWHIIGTVIVVVTLLVLVALWGFYKSPDPQPPVENMISNDESWPSETLPSNPIITEPSHPSGVDDSIAHHTSTSEPDEETLEITEQSKPADETPSDEPDMTDSATPTTDFSTLRVHFKQRAWMRITDHSGNKVYEGNGDAGEILPLKGTPPFYLKVGNIDGVDIENHGEISSIKTYTKRGKRTFIIGNDE